jgi:hypothetical protein
MSGSDLSVESGVGTTSIGRWERGEIDLLSGTVRELQEAFERRGVKFLREADGSLGLVYPKKLDDADVETLRKKKGK